MNPWLEEINAKLEWLLKQDNVFRVLPQWIYLCGFIELEPLQAVQLYQKLT